jgi:CDP-diacylglycerol--glycerol-3-phosphate 3-phosphatidyltransferase
MHAFPYASVIFLAMTFLGFMVGLAVFAWRVAGPSRPPSARLAAQGRSPLLGALASEFGLWFLGGPIRLLTRLRVSPDVITWLGLLLALGAGLALAGGWFGLGGWLFMIGAMLDSIDGHVARGLGRAGHAGGYLDAVLDRLADMAVFLGLMVYYANRRPAMVLCGIALVVSNLISYSRAKAEALGVEPPRVLLRRPERTVYLGCAIAVSPIVVAFAERGAAQPWHVAALAGVAFVAVLGAVGLVRMGAAVRRQLRRGEGYRSTSP